jgi:tRNA dimethylallyltransferase
LSIARLVDAEIVNADSVQVYRGFDIGASKPSEEDFKFVPHHMYSMIEPDDPFDAGAFVSCARKVIGEILGRGKLPLVVGGTGLYIRSLLCGLMPVEVPTEVKGFFASKIEELECAAASEEEFCIRLHSWLRDLDPESAKRISQSDLQRTKRAILVCLAANRSFAQMQVEHGHRERKYRALVVVLLPERNDLYRAAELRAEQMLEGGLIEEVKTLREQYPLNSRAFDAIGYRHVGLFLDGELGYPEMLELLKRDTRRFAKRQITWWRNQPNTLGWTRWQQAAPELNNPVFSEEIPDRLAREIGIFCQPTSRQGGDAIYYLPVEGYRLF